MPSRMSAEELKVYLNLPGDVRVTGGITLGLIGALIGHLERVCGGKEQRVAFLRYVYGVESSKSLSMPNWSRIHEWLAPRPVEDIEGNPSWEVRPDCYDEARLAVIEGQKLGIQKQTESGQATLWSDSL